jgi:hypothetical protein
VSARRTKLRPVLERQSFNFPRETTKTPVRSQLDIGTKIHPAKIAKITPLGFVHLRANSGLAQLIAD